MITPPIISALLTQPGIEPERGPQSRSGISGGWLHPDAAKWPVIADARVQNTVERDASRDTEIFFARRLVQPGNDVQHRLFQRDLQRAGDIVMTLLQRLAPAARRPKAFLKAERPDGILALAAGGNNFTKSIEIVRPAERGQRHYLVFV